MTTIELNDEDCLKYQEFCKYYDTFSILKECGALNLQSGKSVIHFDQNGVIRKIECEAVVFIRKDVLLVP